MSPGPHPSSHPAPFEVDGDDAHRYVRYVLTLADELRSARDWLGDRNEPLHAVVEAHEESDRRDLRDPPGDDLTDTLHEPREPVHVLSPLAELDADLAIVLGMPDHRAGPAACERGQGLSS